ncbi:MAG: guanylate cyclase [Treponema sp.]|nr:guanylate cyclase [Treponema sp.]
MSKKILILETSATIQKLFTNTLDSQEYAITFENNEKNIFTTISDLMPDLFLINCNTNEIRSFELIKIMRSLELPLFKNLAIGMYATTQSALDEYFAKECGANAFIRLSDQTLVQNIADLAKIETQSKEPTQNNKSKYTVDKTMLLGKATFLLQSSSYKNLMLTKMNDLVGMLETIEDMIQDYLLLVAQVSEVPLAAMYITQNDGAHGYYVCADTIAQKDVIDFLTVCSTDYEKNQNKGTISNIKAKILSSDGILETFYNDSIQLSSYEYGVIKTEKTVLGTVHIVAQGNIISDNYSFFDYCVRHAAKVFDKALIVEKKIFFEKRIRRAFSRFVPEQIIDSLVLQSDETNKKLGVGETRSVAILFSDIRSFTNISEKNRPDVLVAFLNRYFSTMVDIIKKHGGTIDKFIGDAIMAEFGTPVSYDDNCRRAIMAAYEMRDALSSVEMGELIMPEGMTFNIGIGIHYGDVIVGSIGSKDKTDYSVIGDNVNLASRLEGLTKTYGTQILVSDSVRSDAGENSFCFRHLDDVRVKGKKNAVAIYAVDRNENEFSTEYKNAYIKGMELYKQGIWHLAKDYFSKALDQAAGDKAAKLMLERCTDFIINPPENWDGAIAFMTK